MYGASGPHGQPQYHSLRTSHESGTGSTSSCATSTSENTANLGVRVNKWLPPDEDLSDALLDESFVRSKDGRDRAFLEQLGVQRLSLGKLFADWLLPRLDPEAHHAAALQQHEANLGAWKDEVASAEQAWAATAEEIDSGAAASSSLRNDSTSPGGSSYSSSMLAEYPPEPELPPVPRSPVKPKPLPPALAREVCLNSCSKS